MDFDEYDYLEKAVENPELPKEEPAAAKGVRPEDRDQGKGLWEGRPDDAERSSRHARSEDDRLRDSSRHSRDGERGEKERHRSGREHREREERSQKDREREKERDRERDRERIRERDREMEAERERERERARPGRGLRLERHHEERDRFGGRSKDVEFREREPKENQRDGRRHRACAEVMEIRNKDSLRQCPPVAFDSGEAGGADSPVMERCWDQREALPGEPRCVICGRYGEYICDETDDDICSTECKKTLLDRLRSSQKVAMNQVSAEKLPAHDECFYVRDNIIGQTDSLRKKINVHVKGESVPAPVMSFSSFQLPQKLQDNLESAGYEIPTPVQMQVIPVALDRRNLLVSAETGSGKTASFLIPIVAHCSDIRSKYPVEQKRPQALVLAPTRELCVQVEDQAKLLGKGLPFKTALVVGGDALPGQVHRLKQGIELIVGTPGRLIDLLAKHDFELDEIGILVLDEVDCMLHRGFWDQVMQIFQALSQPQVLMFSATVSKDVEKMASLMAKDLVRVSAGKPNRPNESVTQVVIWVDSKHKKQKLFDILESTQHFKPPAVVFVESRLGADLLSEAITVVTGIKAFSIHGEKGMKERRETMRLFLTGEVSILVATGVLGRGVDLVSARQVIIFDMPKSMQEYIHQVGRASRMGEKGTAIIFLNDEDNRLFKELIQVLKSSGAAIPRELANSHYSRESQLLNGRQKRRKRGTG